MVSPRKPQAQETRAIHAGSEANRTAALTPPIFQSSTFRLPDSAVGAAYSRAIKPEQFYTRWGNPTTKQCELVLADLEGAEAALLTSSGMAALTLLLFSEVRPGDHIVIGRAIYSGCQELVEWMEESFGIEATFADARDCGVIAGALREKTRLILVESPTNPTMEICDLRAIGVLGRERGVLTAIDGTFATPVNQRPIELGFDVVVHAATKGLGGHCDLTAGVICTTRERIERYWKLLKLFGPCLSPFEAWLLLRGLKTLVPRVRQQNETALGLAHFLESRPEVARVHYPGLKSHPQHDLAATQMDGFGSIISFELTAGYEAGVRFAEAVRCITLAVSLGGVETLVQHPASMTHGMLSPEQIAAAGIAPNLLRLSVGLENLDDLKDDIDQALTAKY